MKTGEDDGSKLYRVELRVSSPATAEGRVQVAELDQLIGDVAAHTGASVVGKGIMDYGPDQAPDLFHPDTQERLDRSLDAAFRAAYRDTASGWTSIVRRAFQDRGLHRTRDVLVTGEQCLPIDGIGQISLGSIRDMFDDLVPGVPLEYAPTAFTMATFCCDVRQLPINVVHPSYEVPEHVRQAIGPVVKPGNLVDLAELPPRESAEQFGLPAEGAYRLQPLAQAAVQRFRDAAAYIEIHGQRTA